MANGISQRPRFDLRTARLNLGYSTKGLALKLKLHHDTVRRLEEGDPVRPSSAKKVADYFGITVVELVGVQSIDCDPIPIDFPREKP